MADLGFSCGGPTPYYFVIFSQKLHKMKEFGPRGLRIRVNEKALAAMLAIKHGSQGFFIDILVHIAQG